MSPVTISVFNNKGGVGKTNTIWNLSMSLSEKDKKILLVDFDPQCNLYNLPQQQSYLFSKISQNQICPRPFHTGQSF